ncbi:hypothetical protein REPUB_Repub07fG0195300 [Reevesia pubescens]
MDRRLPRCPALKSPVLSPKSPAIYENYKSGCAWGLIHFFDFRQGHSQGKLISDKKRVNRQAKGDGGHARNRPNFLSNEKAEYIDDALDDKNLAVNSGMPEVKNVIEEVMFVKHQTKKKRALGEMQNQQFNPKIVGHSKNCRKASKSSKKSFRCDAGTEGYRQPSDQNMVDKSSSSNNLASVTEATGNDVRPSNGGNCGCKSIRGRKHDHPTEINLQVHMNEAVEAFVSRKLTDGVNLSRNEVVNRSTNFIDALEILNSNKELFMKLLQDPNSLLVKHIQDLRDSQAKKKQPQSSSKAKISQCQPKEAGECEGPAHAQMSESCDSCPSKGTDMSQPLNTIVVLKAGIQNCPDRINNWPSPQSNYSLRNKERSVRPAFLSFEHMKRKLRHALRVNKKEQCQMSNDGIHKSLHDFKQFEDGGQEMSRQANERISASKSYLDAEKVSESSHEVNRRDGMGQTSNFGSGIGSKAASSTESCHRTSNLLTVRPLKGKFHPRKHLSDMLNKGNEDFSRKQTLRTLDRLMSSTEYDLLPTLTPGRDREHEFASPQMRFSPYSNFSTVNGYKRRVQKEKKTSCLSSSTNKNLGTQAMTDNKKVDDRLKGAAKKSFPGDLFPATEVLQTVYSLSDDLSHRVNQNSVCPGKVMERNHAVRWGKHESNALEVGSNINPRTEAVNIYRGSEYFECSKLDSPSGDQTSSSSLEVYSSSSLRIQRAEDSDIMIDGAEQPSPISVLEQFFIEDNTSSPSTVSLAAEPPVEPLSIDMEELYASSLVEFHLDLKISTGTSMDKQGSLSECIRAVLQISGLNWDELSRRWRLSDQVLESSLFDDVEVWPEKFYTDRRLLFGYINEVLLEIYQCYFRCSPWVSLLNPRPRPAVLSKNMVHEVLRHVDWLLLSELPQQTLQQLVEKDLGKFGTWMDIQLDTEDVVTELVDSILEDLIMFALLSGGARAVEEWETISEEENLEMERQLKVINKPPIKSFRTEHGDIFDCIDIYKQHAFDHPLLKDHKVQMRPKRIAKETMGGKAPRFLPKQIRCPPGSVLIKRTTKEDLILAKKVKALGLNYPKSPRFRAAPNDLVENRKGFLSAYAQYTKHNFGAKATMNVWNPSVSSDQSSFSIIWIENGPIETINAILAGVGVQPSLFSSNYTRLTTSWTADAFSKTGCYNYICPGFVQVSSEISLGLVLNQISTYNGPQKEIEIAVIRDGEWWLKFFNKFVGYWPQKLFTYMYGGANYVMWGGQVYSPTNEPSPAMGSGHFPEDGHDGKSAYFKQMQIWDNINFVDPDPNFVNVHSDRPECYSVQTAQEGAAMDVFYGGPGQCNI